jgi:hypothetical protein
VTLVVIGNAKEVEGGVVGHHVGTALRDSAFGDSYRTTLMLRSHFGHHHRREGRVLAHTVPESATGSEGKVASDVEAIAVAVDSSSAGGDVAQGNHRMMVDADIDNYSTARDLEQADIAVLVVVGLGHAQTADWVVPPPFAVLGLVGTSCLAADAETMVHGQKDA